MIKVKYTEIKSILPYLSFSIPIGVGTSAICFLMRDGNVLKLYINTYLKKELFYKYDMKSHLKYLNEISNDSYIGPNEVLIKDNQVVGYIYSYIKAKTLNKISNDINMKEILNAYQNLFDDTKEVSKNNFRIADLHNKNILYNSKFYIIDLDKGYQVDETNDNLFSKNICDINKNIIKSIFDLGFYEYMNFDDDKLEELYFKSLYDEPECFFELIEKLFSNCATKKEVKQNNKIRVYKKDPNYYPFM